MEPNSDVVIENDDSSEGAARLPMALLAVERASKTRLLFDVSTRSIRGVSSSSVFPGAACAFENAGWLLMVQHKEQGAAAAVFLVHPSSGRRVDLPAFTSASGGQGLFVFHVSPHGAPLVVARVETLSFVPTVHVACPGDVYWSVYAGTPRRRGLPEPASIPDVALVGTQAVCLDAGGEVLVFDVAEMTWRRGTPAVRPDSGAMEYERFLVAAGGELLLVSRPRAMEKGAFRFFRLDMAALEWSPLERRELEDTGWFLCRGQSFRAREPGKRRVYAFTGPGGPSLKSITNVWAYDLDDGSVEMVIPASIVTEARRWVRPIVFAAPAK